MNLLLLLLVGFFFRAYTIERQTTPLVRNETGQQYELVHIAKTAGRSIKFQSNRLGDESPLRIAHKHSVRVSDVIEDPTKTAVVVLRDPVDRIESAFTFVRSGGFGNRINSKHALQNYNATDAFVEALAENSQNAIEAVRCDAKIRFCAPKKKDGEDLDLAKHASVEFRPQVWWLNVNDPTARVKVVCYPDIHLVFPALKKTSRAKLSKMSAKGHWYIKRGVSSDANKAKIRELYSQDYKVYNQYCL